MVTNDDMKDAKEAEDYANLEPKNIPGRPGFTILVFLQIVGMVAVTVAYILLVLRDVP